MIPSKWFRGTLLAGLAALLGASAQAGTIILSADADIWMSSVHNRQEDDGISVWQSGDRQGAVDFNLAGVTQPILGAYLQLYAANSGNNTGPITQEAYLLVPPGTATLSWATLPGRTQIPLDSLGFYTLGSGTVNTWHSSDSASAADVAKLEAVRTGAGSLTFLLKATAGMRDWDDKAGWLGDNPPRLVLITESTWNVASGDWNTAANWDPVGVPASGDVIRIANGGTASAATNLKLGDSSGEDGVLRVSSGTLNVAGYLQLGNHGKSALLQTTGGVVNCNGSGAVALDLGGYSDGEGLYHMDGGQLNVPAGPVLLGDWGKGTFIQEHGQVTLGAQMVLGVGQEPSKPRSSGRYEIRNGTLTLASTTTGFVEVGNVGDGAFVQSGGTVTLNRTTSGAAAALYLGGAATGVGTYQMSGGTLNLPSGRLSVGEYGTGTFLQTGGDVTIGTPVSDALSLGFRAGSTGTYDISGGSLAVNSRPVWIADGGNGTFIQSGGSVTISHNSGTALGLAYSAGTQSAYRISGGSLSVPNGAVQVGRNGAGRFEVIGSGAIISLLSYTQSGISTLGATIDSGGLSTINLSGTGAAATFTSGAMLDMDIEGGVALTTAKSFDIMRAPAGTISGTPVQTDLEPGLPYTVTNTGTVLNATWSGAGYGPVTHSYADPAEIVIGGGGAASGYLTILGTVPGRELFVRLDVRDNAGPLSAGELDALAGFMRGAGLTVYTSHAFLEAPYDLLLTFPPAATTSYLAWDLTDYDAARAEMDGLVIAGLSVGVPEPASFLLLALGALTVVVCRRRR